MSKESLQKIADEQGISLAQLRKVLSAVNAHGATLTPKDVYENLPEQNISTVSWGKREIPMLAIVQASMNLETRVSTGETRKAVKTIVSELVRPYLKNGDTRYIASLPQYLDSALVHVLTEGEMGMTLVQSQHVGMATFMTLTETPAMVSHYVAVHLLYHPMVEVRRAAKDSVFAHVNPELFSMCLGKRFYDALPMVMAQFATKPKVEPETEIEAKPEEIWDNKAKHVHAAKALLGPTHKGVNKGASIKFLKDEIQKSGLVPRGTIAQIKNAESPDELDIMLTEALVNHDESVVTPA
jgi:hypothetical protein